MSVQIPVFFQSFVDPSARLAFISAVPRRHDSALLAVAQDDGGLGCNRRGMEVLQHEPGSRAVPWEGSPAGLSTRLRVDTSSQC